MFVQIKSGLRKVSIHKAEGRFCLLRRLFESGLTLEQSAAPSARRTWKRNGQCGAGNWLLIISFAVRKRSGHADTLRHLHSLSINCHSGNDWSILIRNYSIMGAPHANNMMLWLRKYWVPCWFMCISPYCFHQKKTSFCFFPLHEEKAVKTVEIVFDCFKSVLIKWQDLWNPLTSRKFGEKNNIFRLFYGNTTLLYILLMI